jgi:hypothetical protein
MIIANIEFAVISYLAQARACIIGHVKTFIAFYKSIVSYFVASSDYL